DLGGPVGELPRRHDLPGPASDQEKHGPRGVGGAGGGEIPAQGGDFLAGFVGLVQGREEIGEGLHGTSPAEGASPWPSVAWSAASFAASSRSPSNSVAMAWAS